MQNVIAPHLNNINTIIKWTIDREDIDNVLRIECLETLTEIDVIKLIHLKGFEANLLLE
ncbi:hypothetical protein [uncultured Flavobacterium sp.]|uniref:hypothetical protein n=1 Tax=uncultured Flavobacterium sp. TaxID=165435 RepID=UPI0025D6BCE4|nr:hypothetical protein [uncultured Flavobacterium sp.]